MANIEKRSSQLQSIVFRDQFVFSRKTKEKVATIVSPFKKIGEDLEGKIVYTSNLVFPDKLLNRILNVREHIKSIFSYSIQSNDMVNVNCLNEIPIEVFQNFNQGIIHFTYEENGQIIEIDDRGCWEELPPTEKKTTQYQQDGVKFSTKTLKVFPILLDKGFIFSYVSPSTVTMYLTLINSERLYVGLLADSFQLSNLIRNIFPLFPNLFTITITDRNTANVFLKNIPEIKKILELQNKKEIVLKFTYPLHKFQTVKCETYAVA